MSGLSLAMSVARRIEEEIVAAGWPVGEVIGSESELMERLHVGRGVLREAVRIVESHGVARMRRGPGGGLVVTAPQPDGVGRSMALYLRFAGASRSELFELRMAIELLAVARAAARVDERGAARLRACVAGERRRGVTTTLGEAPHDLHQLIAELSGSPATALLSDVLGGLTADRAQTTVSEREAAGHLVAHRAIVEALVAGDAPLAQLRMRRHLEAVAPVYADAHGPWAPA